MNKKAVEAWLPAAFEALKQAGIVNDGIAPAEFSGYISSFGASIIQSGLLPSVAFYERNDAGSKNDKAKLTKAILKIINKEATDSNLLDYIIKNQNSSSNLKEDIINAAIAIKLAIRTFELKK